MIKHTAPATQYNTTWQEKESKLWDMEEPGWISRELCQKKEANAKHIRTVWFLLDKITEMENMLEVSRD